MNLTDAVRILDALFRGVAVPLPCAGGALGSGSNRALLDVSGDGVVSLRAQAAMAETVELADALLQDDAAALLDVLTAHRPLDPAVRQSVLALLEGHPLALNWAGSLLVRGDEDPAGLAAEWKAGGLPRLSDPRQAERTLHWLFNRSVRGADDAVRQALAAAGLLARAHFPLGAMVAAIGGTGAGNAGEKGALEALKSLVQRGLLRRAGSDRWQFTHVLGYRFARDEERSDPALRQRLGHWLSDDLEAALRTTMNVETAPVLADLLHHAGALLRADGDQRLWEPLERQLLYGVADRLEDIERLDLVVSALGALTDWLARFPRSKGEEPFWLGQRCVLMVDQGDVLRAQGDLAGALAAYRESQAVRRRLAEADASNAGWQQDLSFTLTRLAEIHEQRGEGAEALSRAEESLSIDERLSALDPTSATWQEDVAVSRALVARLRGGSR